jgi:hypothetical protein
VLVALSAAMFPTAPSAHAGDVRAEACVANSAPSLWLSWSRVDPVAEAKALSMPMLMLQGDSDFHMLPTLDFARWKHVLGGGRPHVAFHLYPGLGHLFYAGGPDWHRGRLPDAQPRRRARHRRYRCLDQCSAVRVPLRAPADSQ